MEPPLTRLQVLAMAAAVVIVTVNGIETETAMVVQVVGMTVVVAHMMTGLVAVIEEAAVPTPTTSPFVAAETAAVIVTTTSPEMTTGLTTGNVDLREAMKTPVSCDATKLDIHTSPQLDPPLSPWWVVSTVLLSHPSIHTLYLFLLSLGSSRVCKGKGINSSHSFSPQKFPASGDEGNEAANLSKSILKSFRIPTNTAVWSDLSFPRRPSNSEGSPGLNPLCVIRGASPNISRTFDLICLSATTDRTGNIQLLFLVYTITASTGTRAFRFAEEKVGTTISLVFFRWYPCTHTLYLAR
ncbi:hypothetical protein BX600DRAFT_459873 [Xylariales sp. PMI_506]|nr:hypothetical protein BX600DRAFT_459873 [Xylariales sp. PMI_506]